MNQMLAYKLFRVRNDGSLGSLFIGRKERYWRDKWMQAKCFPTKGFKIRKGWHCLPVPHAPHLSTTNRRWMLVAIRDYKEVRRPESQGGTWYIAKWLRIV